MTTPRLGKQVREDPEAPSTSTPPAPELSGQAPVGNQDLLQFLRTAAGVATAVPTAVQQREPQPPAPGNARPAVTPAELVRGQFWRMMNDDFDTIALLLYTNFLTSGQNYGYVDDVFEELSSDWEDNVAAAFTHLLDDAQLDTFASSYNGRATLTTLYDAMITGSVSDFEREQAQRILVAKTRQMKPEDYVASTQHRPGGGRTRCSS